MLELELLKYLAMAAVGAGISAYVVGILVKFLFLRENKLQDYGDWD